jgi:hypothetical protein
MLDVREIKDQKKEHHRDLEGTGLASFTSDRYVDRSDVFRPNNVESQPTGHLI